MCYDLRVTCSKLIVSRRAVMGSLRLVFMHVMHVNTQNNNNIERI